MSLISLLVVVLILGIVSVVVVTHVDGGDACPHAASTTTIIPGFNSNSLDLPGQCH